MLSKPPATIALPCPPHCNACDAIMTLFIPEAHTLLIVVHTVPSDSPAPNIACRAGACPCPADTTVPRIASVMGTSPKPCTTLRIATDANALAERLLREPWNFPMGVRAIFVITMLLRAADIKETTSVLRSVLRR